MSKFIIKALDEKVNLLEKEITIVSINNRSFLLGDGNFVNFSYKIYQNKSGISILEPQKIEPQALYRKFLLIDSDLPQIFLHLFRLAYLYNQKCILDLVELLSNLNPLSYPYFSEKSFYKYKIKRALLHFSYGIEKQFLEKGLLDRKLCEMVVKEKNTLVKYYIYDIQRFQDLLLKHTYLKFSTQNQSTNLVIQPNITFSRKCS